MAISASQQRRGSVTARARRNGSGFLAQLTSGGAQSIEADYFKETNDGAWMLFANGAGQEVKRIKQEYIAVIETKYGEAAS